MTSEQLNETSDEDLKRQLAEYQTIDLYRRDEYKWIRLVQSLQDINENLKKIGQTLVKKFAPAEEPEEDPEVDEDLEEDEEVDEDLEEDEPAELPPRKKKKRI